MKKNILTMAALLIASAAVFTACSNDDDITGEQPANPTGKYTMTINASKDGDATTRALSLDGKTLNVKWAATDQVSVFPEAWSATLTLTPMGALTAAASDNESTTLTGTLTTLPAVNDKLNLLFPRAEWDYTGQTGVLLSDDNSIEKKFDYATAQVTVATAEGDKITADDDADFTSQQAIVKFTLKDKESGNAISASSLKIAAAGGKLVQSRGMKKTYYPEGWEPVSSGNKHYLYIETEKEIFRETYAVDGDNWRSFRLDATYGTDGQLIVGGKYLYRFVFEEGQWDPLPENIAQIALRDINDLYGAPAYAFTGSIPFSDDMYLNAASNFSLVETGEGDPVMGATYGPLTVTPAAATGELTVALRNELGAADSYSFEATDGDNKYIFSRQNVNFENGKYYEITMSMEKVAASKYVDLSTMTGDYTAQDGDVLTGELPSQYHVTIAAGATVTLFNTTIKCGSENYYPAVACQGNATIILKGSNIATSSSSQSSAIQPYYESGYTLTIQGNGSLTATGQVGIGGGPWDSGFNGNITIAGGNITAIGKMGAGIGTGESGSCGNILISGGTVNATGGGSAAGIGSGSYATCGNIEISGGTVNATGGSSAAGIGCGSINSNCGTITITNGVTSVTATKGNNAAYSIGKSNSGGGTCGTITIGGTVYPDGISESPYTYTPAAASTAEGHALSASEVGELVGTDGLAYAAADKDNLPTGVTAAGMVAYKSATAGSSLVIALADEASMMDWSTATSESGAAAHTPTVTGGTWRLPTMDEWKQMFSANGGNEGNSGLDTAITTAGGTALQGYADYWSSSEYNDVEAYSVRLFGVAAIWNNYDKGTNIFVRACFDF